MQVYISGKITGLPITEAERRFREAEELLKALNLNPINPMKNGLPLGATWEEHMAKDIELLKKCDVIFMLDNWQESRGARIEYDFAVGAGKEVMFEQQTREGRDLDRLVTAIHEATGYCMKQITSKSKTRDTFYARMIFAYHCRDMHFETIGRILNRNRSTIDYYVNRYSDEVKFNPAFEKLARKVEKKITRKETV